MYHVLLKADSTDIGNDPAFSRIYPYHQRLDEIAAKFGDTVFGQERACREVARAMLRAEAGMTISTSRPEFSGFFLGGTGVGKTEMARAIAKFHHPESPDQFLKIIDCANFKESYEVARLTGSSPGYVGYGDVQLISPELLKERNVICFDEIEKAHPAFHEVLLSIMDQGRLQVSIGNGSYRDVSSVELDFSRSTVIFTSNVGSAQIHAVKTGKGQTGFIHRDVEQSTYEVGLSALEERFQHMPEFLGRIDAIVVFDDLTPAVVRRVFDKFIDEMNDNQGSGGSPLVVTEDLKDWVISRSNLEYGARGLRRAIEKWILTPAAEVKLGLPPDTPFIAGLAEGEVVFWVPKALQRRDALALLAA